ncbi:protein C1orf43 homolog isoform X1 [Salminus brasiliensis]|uniref:protein C1orf43 homolog isoform X1 n=1 Tax=Salminus brasiliensis TaxID=930266 RepID=UPI003B8337E2
MGTDSPLSGVNVVLVMAYGSLVFVLLFIFVKRQIMRFAMKSRRGPHVPLGHNAPKGLREEIDCRLSKVNDIRYEPRLLSENDDRLKHRGQSGERMGISSGCYNYLYRMQALDAIRDTDTVSHELGRSASALTGRRYRNWLMDLRNSHSLFKSSHSSLVDRLLEGYDNARHGTGVFGEAEFLKYKEDLTELAALVKIHSSSSSLNQQHQSAAKDLTSSPGPSSASTIQVTYLPSSGQRSKRPKHFLELKNFKDNYNTLESTL